MSQRAWRLWFPCHHIRAAGRPVSAHTCPARSEGLGHQASTHNRKLGASKIDRSKLAATKVIGSAEKDAAAAPDDAADTPDRKQLHTGA